MYIPEEVKPCNLTSTQDRSKNTLFSSITSPTSSYACQDTIINLHILILDNQFNSSIEPPTATAKPLQLPPKAQPSNPIQKHSRQPIERQARACTRRSVCLPPDAGRWFYLDRGIAERINSMTFFHRFRPNLNSRRIYSVLSPDTIPWQMECFFFLFFTTI